MREIKFRAFSKVLGYMMPTMTMRELVESDGDTVDYEDLIIMQYTGLKDKSDVEIYEGDILRVANGSFNRIVQFQIYPVKAELNGFTLPMFCWDKNGEDYSDYSHYCEVIGNIYENPELLEIK